MKLLGKMAERPVSLCANGGFAGTIKTKMSGRPSLFRLPDYAVWATTLFVFS